MKKQIGTTFLVIMVGLTSFSQLKVPPKSNELRAPDVNLMQKPDMSIPAISLLSAKKRMII